MTDNSATDTAAPAVETETTALKTPPGWRFEMTDALRTLSDELGIDLSIDIAARLDRGVDKTNAALRLVVEAGIDFISAKSELKHGEFEAWLKEREIAPQRAREAMALAVFAARLPDSERKSLLAMSKKKALILARAEQPVIEHLMEEAQAGAIGDLDALTVADLTRRIRALEATNANLTTEIDTARAAQKNLLGKLQGQFGGEYPEFVLSTRHEANALTEKSLLCFDDLDRLCGELSALGSRWQGDEQSRLWAIAANSVYVHAKALHARSASLLNRLREFIGQDETPAPELLFSEHEIRGAVAMRELMVGAHQQEALLREAKREREKPRKPGRPRKGPAVVATL